MREINIPIHKHTPKRYRKSVWIIRDMFKIGTATLYATNMYNTPLVTDLQRVPKVGIDKSNGIDYTQVAYFGSAWGNTKKLGIFKNLWQNKIRRKND